MALVLGSSPAGPPQPMTQPALSAPGKTLEKAWTTHIAKLDDFERVAFTKFAKNDLTSYLEITEESCKQQRKSSLTFKMLDWLQPLFSITQLLTPSASMAAQAYPNPGCLIMGGITCILNVTDRLQTYQRLTLRALSKMARKVNVLLQFENDVYRDDFSVQCALLRLYGSVLDFCRKAFRFLTKNGELRPEIKGLKLILWKSFDSTLGEEWQSFEDAFDDVLEQANLQDKQRLKQIQDAQRSSIHAFGQALDDMRQHNRYQVQLLERSWERGRELEKGNESLRQQEYRLKMLNWVSQLDFSKVYDERCEEHLSGTGQWLIQHDTFNAWKSAKKSQLLWVYGKPGCGKSFLSAVAISNLESETDDEVTLAYALCSNDDPATQDATNILRALLRQLLGRRKHTDVELKRLYNDRTHPNMIGPNRRDTKSLISSTIRNYAQTFLVIDALDECRDLKSLSNLLKQILQDESRSLLKVLVFSRPDYELDKCFKSDLSLQLDSNTNLADLRLYIEDRFADDSPGSVDPDIRKECFEKADGMFQWIKLLYESIQGPLTRRQKLEIAKKIPSGLEEMYNMILCRIGKQSSYLRETALLVLMWVVYGNRLLKSKEMLEAVADLKGVSYLKEAGVLDDAKHLVSICANLVVVGADDCFHLCHESVRDYLNSRHEDPPSFLLDYQRLEREAAQKMAGICLRYLQLKDFSRGSVSTLSRLRKLLDAYPFLSYATKNWGRHLDTDSERLLRTEILSLVQTIPSRELCLQILVQSESASILTWKPAGRSTPLHLLAAFGLMETSADLHNVKDFIRQPDECKHLPLHYAIATGNREMCHWLIELDWPPSRDLLDGDSQFYPIHAVAVEGWADVLEKLLLTSKDVNLKAGSSMITPLQAACRANSSEAVRTLLEHAANPNLQTHDGCQPLHIACLHENLEMVQLLLEYGADPNSRDATGETPLCHIAQSGSSVIAEVLLNAGADPCIRVPHTGGRTMLHYAAEANSLEIIELLRERNYNLDEKIEGGFTALHLATMKNYHKTVAKLIDVGACQHPLNDAKETPLHLAAEEEAVEAAQILLKTDCNIRMMSCAFRRTPLHKAAAAGNLIIVRAILNSQPIAESRFLIDMPSAAGQTALHLAITSKNLRLTRYLLEIGADASLKGVFNSKSLHYAAHYDQRDLVGDLIRRDSDINFANVHGDTALHFAARGGYVGFIQDLLQVATALRLPIDLNCKNSDGSTPLHRSIDCGYSETALFLLDQKVISSPDKYGNYPIHEAASNGMTTIVSRLLNRAGLREKNIYGQTPLMCAAAEGHLGVVQILMCLNDNCMNEPDTDGLTPIMAALINNHPLVANLLLDSRVDVTTRTVSNDTIVHAAARARNIAVLNRLARECFSDGLLNKWGETPLLMAASKGDLELVRNCILHGFGNITDRDVYGVTCVEAASQAGNLATLKFFEEQQARFDQQDERGQNAATFAASSGQWEILPYLEACGSKADRYSFSQPSALYRAAQEGYVKTAQYLVAHHPKLINAASGWARATPLIEATISGNVEVAKFLIKAGADPYQRDAHGLCAYDYALSRHPIHRHLLMTGHFYQPPGESFRISRTYEAIRTYCGFALEIRETQDVADQSKLLRIISCLVIAFLRAQDYVRFENFFQEAAYRLHLEYLDWSYMCGICRLFRFPGNVYYCKQCVPDTIICDECYRDYNSNKSNLKAMETIVALEKQVQKLRVEADGSESLVLVAATLYHFQHVEDWARNIAKEYEAWNHKHKPEYRYESLQTPGWSFLKITLEASDLLCNATCQSANFETRLKQLQEQYSTLLREHKSDREITTFYCKNHKYAMVRMPGLDDVRPVSNLSQPQRKTLPVDLLQETIDDYTTRLSKLEPVQDDSSRLPSITIRPEHAHTETDHSEEPSAESRIPPLARQSSYPRRSLNTDNASRPILTKLTLEAEAMSLTDRYNSALQLCAVNVNRTDTFPILTEAISGVTSSGRVEMLNPKVMAIIDEFGGPQSNAHTDALTTGMRSEGMWDRTNTPSTICNEKIATSSKVSESRLAQTIGQVPDLIKGGKLMQKEGLTKGNGSQPFVSVDKGRAQEQQDDTDNTATLVRDMYLSTGDVVSEKATRLLCQALDFAEIIHPGFIAEYVAMKRAEVVQRMEKLDDDIW